MTGNEKTELRGAARISSGTLAKLGKNESVTTDILVRICHALNCDNGDIVEVIPGNLDEVDTHKQECR